MLAVSPPSSRGRAELRLDLFRAGTYVEVQPSGHALASDITWPDNQGFFKFEHVPPGDYILVFNNERNPETPFNRTFFPNAAEVTGAEIIHLNDGQQRENTNIRLEHKQRIRTLSVRVVTKDGNLNPGVLVRGKPDQGGSADVIGTSNNGLMAVSLLREARYTFHAEVLMCFPRSMLSISKGTQSESISVNGDDDSVSGITLILPAKTCFK
jgi:hypothetical protein